MELFDSQNVLGNEIDKLTAMMSKLTTKSNSQDRPYTPKIYHGKGEDKEELIVMIELGSKADVV